MKKLKELARRFKHKILSESLPAEKIAGGWATGIFFGFLVPFGFQLIVAFPFMFLKPFKTFSKVGMTTGTFVTNPFTIWFLYPIQTFVANQLFFGGTLTWDRLMHLEWNWSLGAEVLYSYAVGGLMMAILMTPITYIAVKKLIVHHRERK